MSAALSEPAAEAWRPNPGPQTAFLASTTDEVLYGGAAGGGKSAALIALPIRWIHLPRFRALILRRETPQLADLWDKAASMYSQLTGGRARIRNDERTVTFPSGARIWFTHCEYEHDVSRFDGHEYQLIAFDELTHFTEGQYTRICARLRGPKSAPKFVRSTTNPGSEGHEWVFARWGPWLDPSAATQARPGERLYYLPGGAAGEWCAPGESRSDGAHTIAARSRTFIPARLADNPHIGAEYLGQLADLDAVRRAQLKDGNWLIRPGRGLYFRRAWISGAAAVPAGARGVRYWDRAATEAKPGTDPDWTVGVRMWLLDGVYYVDDVVRLRGTPAEVERTILTTAAADTAKVIVGIEQDPGQAGVFERDYYVRKLAGFRVEVRRPDKDKVTRAGPFSSQVEHGNVRYVLRAGQRWLSSYLEELEGFPEGAHDDQVDASSGAFAVLNRPTVQAGTYWGGHAGV